MSPLLFMLLVACGEPSPETGLAATYSDQLKPLLYENGLLADQIYETAAAAQGGKLDAAAVEVRWASRVTPVAEHLADQAELIIPPTGWETRHDELVEIWTDRADGYRALTDALARGDRDQWREGRKQADESKVREERWFIEVNRLLAPHGIALDQLP
ncbi:MAG: hypothetical protein KC912_06405 [Proteobacteria bacterium]|nr:hypothetical protein [Pseudomonadota bacterium]